MNQTLILPVGNVDRDAAVRLIQTLPAECAWRVTVEEYKPRRTDHQNAYLWGICYRIIKEHLEGWNSGDVHEFLMGECFGWQTIEGLGAVRHKPLRRSSKLNIEEFSQYIEFVQRRCAELGIVIPDPEQT